MSRELQKKSSPGNGEASKGGASSFLWPYFPLSILATVVGIYFIGLFLAAKDPSFAVEEDYYRQALQWDKKMEQERLNRELGWKIQLSALRSDRGIVLSARLLSSEGEVLSPQKLEAVAFHNARARHKFRLTFKKSEKDDTFSAAIPATRSGLWIFRFTAEAGGKKFTQELRLFIE